MYCTDERSYGYVLMGFGIHAFLAFFCNCITGLGKLYAQWIAFSHRYSSVSVARPQREQENQATGVRRCVAYMNVRVENEGRNAVDVLRTVCVCSLLHMAFIQISSAEVLTMPHLCIRGDIVRHALDLRVAITETHAIFILANLPNLVIQLTVSPASSTSFK